MCLRSHTPWDLPATSATSATLSIDVNIWAKKARRLLAARFRVGRSGEARVRLGIAV